MLFYYTHSNMSLTSREINPGNKEKNSKLMSSIIDVCAFHPY